MVSKSTGISGVNTVTGLTGSGMKDWFVQRFTAVLMAVYLIVLVAYLAGHYFKFGGLNYLDFMNLFNNLFFKISTFVFLLFLMLHAWIGVWTIFTDYIHCSVLRGTLFVLIFLVMAFCTLWGAWILWS